MSETRKETLNCPRDCEGEVVVSLEYEPADPDYGADADGNRGIYVRGYWTMYGADPVCSTGHTLTAEEQKEIIEQAESADEEEQGCGDYYDGPDTLEERDDR